MPQLRELTLASIATRLLVAVVLGGIIGVERGMKNRPAGLRTYMLVCIGSSVVMMINQYACEVFGTGDPVRLGAQVISGIGFLGAGTIIVTSHNQIMGLTTAAGLWASACIGLAIGIGLYEVAIPAGIAVFIVLTVLHRLDFRMRSRTRIVDLYVELEDTVSLGTFIRLAREHELELSNLQREDETNYAYDTRNFIVTVKGPSPMNADRILHLVQSFDGVKYAEVL